MITERRLRRMREVLSRRRDDLVVVLENVYDAHNASAVLRSCDAFGVGAIALCYTDEEFPKISSGVAANVQKWLRIERYGSVEECVAALRARSLRIHATELGGEPLNYLDVDWRGPSAIVLGNEHRGCSDEMLAAADARVAIPMIGFVESLNVSVAAAVLLAEASRQRRAEQPPWSAAKQAVLQEWITREEREPAAKRADEAGE